MEKTASLHLPALVVIRGLPGSGKTFLAEALEHKLSQTLGRDQVAVLDPDKVDTRTTRYENHVASLTAEGVDPKLHLYRYSRTQAFEAIEAGKLIIWNQAFTNLETFTKMIDRLAGFAQDHHLQLNLLIVEMQVDHKLAQERVAERTEQTGREVTDEAFKRFVASYDSWADQFRVVKVSGEDDVAKSVAAVEAALVSL